MEIPVMYLFVNSDLNLTKGQISAQIGHVVQKITDDIIRSGYESRQLPESYKLYMRWNNGTIIVKRATTEQLNELMKMPDSRAIIDNIKTQPNCLTVVGFFPSLNLTENFKTYKLL
jgi:peptidyl-tRNA hydrolase